MAQAHVRFKHMPNHQLTYSTSHQPAYGLVEATFCASSLGRSFPNITPDLDVTPDLKEIFQCAYEDMDMHRLGIALFEQGVLSTRRRWVKRTYDTLGLGDIGYMTEHNNFVVIGNVFNLILSTYGRTPSHCLDVSNTWDVDFYLNHLDEYCSLEKLEDTERLEYSGQSYWRQRHIDVLPTWFLHKLTSFEDSNPTLTLKLQDPSSSV